MGNRIMAIICFMLLIAGCTSKTWYKPPPGATWHWQLSERIDTSENRDIYDIDLFNTPQGTIDDLHVRGIKVICYFSAGTVEAHRKDANEFPKSVIGNALGEWPDEQWLDISRFEEFRAVMEERLDLAASKKCDGVEPDNVDAYIHETGFNLTYEHQLKYNKWLAQEAHERGLSIGLKNDLDQIPELVGHFDFAVNEQCFEHNECEKLLPFIRAQKAVFGAEYTGEWLEVCSDANRLNFSWIMAERDLNGLTTSCSR